MGIKDDLKLDGIVTFMTSDSVKVYLGVIKDLYIKDGKIFIKIETKDRVFDLCEDEYTFIKCE